MKRTLARAILARGLFAAALLASAATHAFTPVSGSINADTSWPAAAGPYHAVGDLYVAPGVTLSIEPGTVVKFAGTSLYVAGTLMAGGSAGAPIVFTSVQDDTFGGDSNGDGSATAPAGGQWVGILVGDGGNATFDHATVRHAGAYYGGSAIWTGMGAIYKAGAGTLAVTNSTVETTTSKGIWLAGATGSVTVAHSLIQGHALNGILVENATANLAFTGNTLQNNTGSGISVNNSSPAITGNTATGNTAYGLYFTGLATPASVAGNTLDGNAAGAIGMEANSSATVVADDNIFAGPLFVTGAVTRAVSWPNNRTYVIGDILVNAGATLTIPAGRVVKATGSLYVYGTVNVEGSAAQPVYFTSTADDSVGGDSNGDGSATAPAPGQWVGIVFDNGGGGSIDHAVLRYAGAYLNGSAIWTGMGTIFKSGAGTLAVTNSILENSSTKGIWISGATGSVTIANSVIRRHALNGILVENAPAILAFSGNLLQNNTGSGIDVTNSSPSIVGNTAAGNTAYGLAARGAATPLPVSANVLNGNAAGPIGVDANSSLMPVADDNVFSGAIQVTAGSVSRPMTWSNNRTYAVAAIVIDAGVTLTIPAGRVIKPTEYIYVNGTLNVAGTAGQPVTFTSIADDSIGGDSNQDGAASAPAKGHWVTLFFADGGNGSIDHAVIRYAGAYMNGSAQWTGMGSVFKTGAGTLAVTNSTLETSATKGIWISGANGSITIGNNTIRDHDVSGILLEGTTGVTTISGNVIRDNTVAGIRMHNSSGTVSGNTIGGNSAFGIYLYAAGATPAITRNRFDSQPYGVYADNAANPVVGGAPGLGNDFTGHSLQAVVNNDPGVVVNARDNWWGTPAGPTVGGINGVSLYVDFGEALAAPFDAGAGAGLVSLWRGEGNALDSVGSNHGTAMNGATYAAGRDGQAFSFDAIDGYVNVPDSDSIRFGAGQPMSMTLWIKRTSTADSQIVFAKRTGCAAAVHYSLQWYGPGNWLGFSSTGGATNGVFTSVDRLPLGAWTHFAVSLNGTTATMYINGLPVASQAMVLDPSNAPLRFGGEPSCAGQFFGGLLDEIRLYNRALSAAEVATASGLVPDPFSFIAQTGVAPGTVVTSNAITVSGISGAVPLSITGGEYSVTTDGGATWSAYSTNQPASVSAGDQVRVRQTAAAGYATQTSATLTVGGIAAAFSVTTRAAPAVVKVISRKQHGNVGPFDLDINMTRTLHEAVTVEPRIANGGHQIVFVFDTDVDTVDSATSVGPLGRAVGNTSVSFAGREVTVTLTGVPDNQRITVGVTGVNGVTGKSVSLGFLVGDVNGSGRINAADISALKARSGSDTTQANFPFDLNITGKIGSTDISAAKARAGWTLPD